MSFTTSFRSTGACVHCRTQGDLWIQSHLGSRGQTYRVGDDIASDIPPSDIADASFVVRAPAPDEPIHVLSTWSCDHCSFENFAEIVFDKGRVAVVRPVQLTTQILNRLHFVEQCINDNIEVFLGRSMWDERGVWPPWLSTLRAVLAAGSPAVEELPAAPAQASAPTPVAAPEDLEDPFPLRYTIDHGHYEVDQVYLGGGADQLCFGRSSKHPGVRYLISTAPNNGLDADRVGRDIMRAAPGLFVPRFLGGYDAPPATMPNLSPYDDCVFVEELPPGSPLGQALPSPRAHAVHLGVQIGHLLGRAASEAGVLNVGLRPEYVWVTVEGGVSTVTGLGGRNRAFFGSARRRRDLPTAPLFTLGYEAPEVARGGPYDDRALVITLAVIVTEWIVGTYPYLPGDGEWGYLRLCKGEHVEIPAEPPLAALLASALRPDPADRPDLATFTSALAALARR